MNDDRREYKSMRRGKARTIDVSRLRRRVSAPAPAREQQQAAARAQWNVELILENCRKEREGNSK